MIRLRGACAIGALVGVIHSMAAAQSGSAASQPSGAAAGPIPIAFKVIEVKGDAKWGPLDAKELQPVKEGDEYPAETKVITGLRSSVKFQIGDEEPYTCMAIETAGKTILSEAYKTGDTKRVRIGVGYGRVKAGVAEGGLQSDFTVDSPVATLSKRGTWGFSLYYERDTNTFEIGLTDHGLVDALSRISAERRSVLPGQLVTQAMRRWLDESQIQRNVAVADVLGQSDMEVAFNRIDQDGLGVTNPGGGRSVVVNLSNDQARNAFQDIANRALNSIPISPPSIQIPSGPQVREEGFFGTGRGDQLIPVLIEAGDAMARKGFAKPGRYNIRREALESWTKGRR